MNALAVILGLALIAVVLADAFETIILPRRVTTRIRPTRLFILTTWRAWSLVAGRLPEDADREGSRRQGGFLGLYGPLALIVLIGLWAGSLIVGFALLYWGDGVQMAGDGDHPGFGSFLYMSGTTFFTVGFGDVTPASGFGRALAVLEGGTGFGFLAVVISYLPTIFGAFAGRETDITLLDARAGSPPSAAGFLSRTGPDAVALDRQLRDWEGWSARLLESHLSYPILVFFRSQHERQSWLATLTLILDVSALVLVGVGPDGAPLPRAQARLTFAIARHAIGDLSQILRTPPISPDPDRLPAADLERLRALLAKTAIPLRRGEAADRQLAALRALYEPYAAAIGGTVALALPPWLPVAEADDWQTTAWQYDPRDAARAVDPDGDGHKPAASIAHLNLRDRAR